MTAEQPPPARRADTAMHEAAHAVVAWYIGLRPVYASITPESGSHGRTTFGSQRAGTAQERAVALAAVWYAGHAVDVEQSIEDSAHDVEAADAAIAAAFREDERPAAHREARERAAVLVGELRPQIVRVALALRMHGAVDSVELAVMIPTDPPTAADVRKARIMDAVERAIAAGPRNRR